MLPASSLLRCLILLACQQARFHWQVLRDGQIHTLGSGSLIHRSSPYRPDNVDSRGVELNKSLTGVKVDREAEKERKEVGRGRRRGKGVLQAGTVGTARWTHSLETQIGDVALRKIGEGTSEPALLLTVLHCAPHPLRTVGPLRDSPGVMRFWER